MTKQRKWSQLAREVQNHTHTHTPLHFCASNPAMGRPQYSFSMYVLHIKRRNDETQAYHLSGLKHSVLCCVDHPSDNLTSCN